MRYRFLASLLATTFILGLAADVAAQDSTPTETSTPATTTPTRQYIESSAGGALRRILFANFDSSADFGQVFVNGSYGRIREQFCPPGNSCQGGDDTADFLLNRFLMQSQTFPATSTSSGFVYTSSGLGIQTLASEAYGPLFGERGMTNGKGQFSLAFSFQHIAWKSMDGSDVRNSDPGLDWGDADYTGIPSESAGGAGYVGRCNMNIDITAAMFSATYGVTDWLDVSTTVPVYHTKVEGSNEFLDTLVAPDGTVSIEPDDTFFVPQGRYYVRGSSTGLGDIEVGAKARVYKSENSNTAMAINTRLRLGTGSFEDMTGTGQTQFRVNAVASTEVGIVSPHGSVGYTFAGEELWNELWVDVGVDITPRGGRLTINGEIVVRRLLDVRGFEPGELIGTVVSRSEYTKTETDAKTGKKKTVTVTCVACTGDTFEVRQSLATRGTHNLLFGVIGAKLRLSGGWLVGAHLILPVGDSGYIPTSPTVNLGISYTLSRGASGS